MRFLARLFGRPTAESPAMIQTTRLASRPTQLQARSTVYPSTPGPSDPARNGPIVGVRLFHRARRRDGQD